MKRIACLLTCSLLTSTSFAAIVGPYVGAGVGYGKLRTPKGYAFSTTIPTVNDNSRQAGGWAGRAYVGYNFNRFLGVESGWAYYPRSVYKASTTTGLNSQLQYNGKAVDVVLKAYLPLGYTGGNIYAILGGAYVTETIQFNNGGIAGSGSINFPPNGKTHKYRTRPLYGVGASFDFPCHITTAVEFTQIQRLGTFSNNGSSIPFIDLATFNLIYRIM